MAGNWYLARNGQKVGPFTTHQIQQLASLGMINAQDHLLEDGATKWVAATALPWMSLSASSEKYFLTLFGQTYGPYTTQQIRAALLAGRISPGTPARPQNAEQWLPLRQITEFSNSLPTTVKESEAPSHIGGTGMTREEAELYLAGKNGDSLAKLVSTLQKMRKKFENNPTMQEVIGKNIEDLLDLRRKANIVPR